MFVKILIVAALVAVVVAFAARGSSANGPEQVYVVKPADTLWSIAVRHYGGDPREGVWKLRKRNHVDVATLVPGMRIVLP